MTESGDVRAHQSVSDSHDPDAVLDRLIGGYVLSQAVYAVASLGVADAIPPGESVPVADIAARVGANEDALYRVMRALAPEGVFYEGPRRAFALTEIGELLRGDGVARDVSLWQGEQFYPVWAHVLEAVRTGMPMAERVWGKPYFDHLAESPAEADVFNRLMQRGTAERGAPLSELDWSAVRTVVDVGGGTGGMLLGLLDREPHLRGIVFDLPYLGEKARETIAKAGLDDRCEFVAGSFFDMVPVNGDVYLLSGILQDWSEADATRILQVCRRAARDGARLVVLQFMVPEGNEPHGLKGLDLQFLVVLGSRMQSEGQLRELLAASGFTIQRILASAGGGVVVEAVAV